MEFKTNNVNETELVYSLLREKYPTQQIEIEYNDNTKEYLLTLTDKTFVEDPEVPIDLNVKVIYGDSLTGDSPLLLKKDGTIYIETIQSIFDENKKVEYTGFKMFDKTIRLEKEYSLTDYQIWTDLGWINIKKVIRHKCEKQIYKILTHAGCIKVTEDHSLLNENKDPIKPTECNLDTKLLSNYPTEFSETCDTISKDRAFIYGFFYRDDGSAGFYECKSGDKFSWALNNTDMNVLSNLKNLLQKEYPNSKPIIYDTLESSGVYKLSMNNPKNMVEEFRHKFYDSDRYKKVPTEILNSNNKIIQSFFDGYWCADGGRKDKEKIGCTRFDNKGQIGSAGLYYLMKKLGYNVSLNTRSDKEKMLRITITKKKQRKINNKIKKIELQGLTNDYVYDIETEIGRFQGGVGDIICKNTDSVLLRFKFNREDFNLNRQDTFKLANICGDNITEIFRRPPICLEFEKVFQPFILLTKKRYIGKKYEDTRDPFKLKTITNSGTAVTRRDFSKMVKDCYKEIIDCMINQGNSDSAQEGVEIYKRYIDQLDAYQIDIDDLITSKTLAKSYSCALCKKKSEWIYLKCEEKKGTSTCGAESPLNSSVCIKCKKPFKCIHKFNLVHVQLAIKMLNRKDEANINDRIPFIFIESDDRTLAKNDLGEDPVYVKKHNLKYNRSFYLESLGKTILAFLKICLNDYPSLLDEAIEYTNEKFDSYGSKRLKPSDFKMEEGAAVQSDE